MAGNFRLLIFGLALLEPIDLTNVNRMVSRIIRFTT
jgi:hypothetical protein